MGRHEPGNGLRQARSKSRRLAGVAGDVAAGQSVPSILQSPQRHQFFFSLIPTDAVRRDFVEAL